MLNVEDIALNRGARRIFSGLCFTANRGEALIVRGPNGIGKSTLLRALAGLLPLSAGTVRLDEIGLSDRAAFSEQVAYAGHLDAIKPTLTLRQNIRVWSALFGAAPGKSETALDRLGLAALANRPAAHCSAGQKRRLTLARLLLSDRPLWLLDEPTVSLDRDATAIVAEMITDHLGAGGVALVATHIDLGLATARSLDLGLFRRDRTQPDQVRADAFLHGDWT